MTTPAKPPAPMEPLKPCPWCGETPDHLGICEGSTYRWLDICCPSCEGGPGELRRSNAPRSEITDDDRANAAALWNRRAAPAPTDGEVGELIARGDQTYSNDYAAEMAAVFRVDWPRIRAALSRQSAELVEAKQGKLAADLRADGWKALSEQTAAELADARGRVADLAMIARRLMVGCDAKHSTVMQALDYLKRHGLAGSPIRANGEPIPGAGAKGDSHE